jgi:hypothetical protein
MGQYHITVNLTKRQFVHPHQIGNGLKLKEQIGWDYSTSTVLFMLVAASTGRGGGDFHCEHPLLGSWAGDRIAIIGDYAETNDLPSDDAKMIYEFCSFIANGSNDADIPDVFRSQPALLQWFTSEAKRWKNISPQVREMVAKEFGIHYKGDSGWLEIGEGPAPAPKKASWVDNNPVVQFYYPNSRNHGLPTYREVRVIGADNTYICGLDTTDKNRFKKFLRRRISQWKGVPIGVFSPESVS